MKSAKVTTIDGNQACAHVAYRVNEVCAIYPITPSSPMAEHADEWSSQGLKNIWGNVPEVIEMQSEAGAAGAVHGALQAGALTTTFTASQGLMLMLPNMYKIAGELTAAVIHVAARSLAAQALSIFGDHTDVMAARTTGFAMLASASVQEAHDMALVTQAATLQSRVPFMHFFDGFRTSHEINKIELLSDADIAAMIRDEWVFEHRQRALNPDNPFIRGTAQNPDVYFQGRETVNPFYREVPVVVENTLRDFEKLTGRSYGLYEYYGHPEAERLVVLMGSGTETAIETAEFLASHGEKVGVLRVRLYRPFAGERLLAAIPATVKKIAVLDRTKEIGAVGEPLYLDVSGAFMEGFQEGSVAALPKIIGGRYGLSSKEFTPAMVRAVFEHLKQDSPRNHFTVGIRDDVSHTSLDYEATFSLPHAGMRSAIFYGLGSDGTVSANKNSIKIIGEHTDLFAQAYFVYDSKKSGSQTISHLRFGPQPIRAPYLISEADFIACHQFNFVKRLPVLKTAKRGGIFLLNTHYPADEVWQNLPVPIQREILEKELSFYVINASQVAHETGLGNRINSIMQTCFFALSGVIDKELAIKEIKSAIEKSYSKKGREVVKLNFRAVDAAIEHLVRVDIPATPAGTADFLPPVTGNAPDYVREVTATLMKGEGDSLPVSKMPVDGTFPSGTTRYEKRNIADFVAEWDAGACIQCGNCSFVCPHSVIRAKFYHRDYLNGCPEGFPSAPISAKGFPDTRYSLQVYAEDCTGCTLCVEACPVEVEGQDGRKAINMRRNSPELVQTARKHIAHFETIPLNKRSEIDYSIIRGAQYLEPLFEFSGACAGCGETPYLKLLTQLFGDRLIVANATGCSSIYGGNLPTTPWTVNEDGRGPAWSNSLFEDNAEFGLGMRITADKHFEDACRLLENLSEVVGEDLVREIINAPQKTEYDIRLQRARVGFLLDRIRDNHSDTANRLRSLADHFIRRSVWLVGGDGWAYDIGSAGVDHAIASGRDVNILVLDTEVYSNTGGQMSKATPTAASAKFAASGKKVGKKDIALQAMSYGNVYVAQIAMGANPQQTLLAIREAEAYNGPSLILAYSHCIAHGIQMEKGLNQQKLAVNSGYWPLLRYNPELRAAGHNPFILDSPRPSIPLTEYAYNEMRYKVLLKTYPEEAERLMKLAQDIVQWRWSNYEEMATRSAEEFSPV